MGEPGPRDPSHDSERESGTGRPLDSRPTSSGIRDLLTKSKLGGLWWAPGRSTWRRFGTLSICLVFQVALPAIVLAPEYLHHGHAVRPTVMATFLPVYLLGLAVSCGNSTAFCIGIAIAIAVACVFGVDPEQVSPSLAADPIAPEIMGWAWKSVVLMFAVDRAYHHMVLGDGFGPFKG
jgi:hypothetical protein